MSKTTTYENVSDIILQSRREVEEMLKAAGMWPLTNEPNQAYTDQLSTEELRKALKEQRKR